MPCVVLHPVQVIVAESVSHMLDSVECIHIAKEVGTQPVFPAQLSASRFIEGARECNVVQWFECFRW